MTRLGLAAIVVLVVLAAGSPAMAQIAPDPDGPPVISTDDPAVFSADQPDSDGFGGLIVVAVVIGVGLSIWKFVSLRDMGIRRGMSPRDSTTAALFSDDRVASTMILKPEVPEPTPPQRPEPRPTPTVEQRLSQISELEAKGLITGDEASERRAEVLDEI